MNMASVNGEPNIHDEAEEFEIEGDCAINEYVGENGGVEGENPLPPAVGMEFESYEDVYYFYNCYAKEHGFGVRVSNTWYRKSKERYRGKLSCSSAGFKKRSEAQRPRPETRTGCPAMIKFRMMDNRRWRVVEVELEHNHLISPASGKFYKSHKITGLGTKRQQTDGPEEVQTVRLFRTVIIDHEDNQNTKVGDGESKNNTGHSCQLQLKQGDAKAIHDNFCHFQLLDPNFVYMMDLNEGVYLRNVFWVDSRSRAAYCYFSDVVAVDITCLVDGYEVPLVTFVGINHHRQRLLLGCGLVAGDTTDSFIWLLRAWLTCMLGRAPQVIITEQHKSLKSAVADVFPRSTHCFSLLHILRKLPGKLGELHMYEEIKVAISKAVSSSLRTDEFEAAWQDMIQCYGARDHPWLQRLYEDRKQWVPAYLKEIFLAGMFHVSETENASQLFYGYLDKATSLQEFFDKYGMVVQTSDESEATADFGSMNPTILLNSRFCFELQMSKLYTTAVFKRFQGEVEGINSCISATQISVDGPIVTYTVKECVISDATRMETRDYEVLYMSEGEVLCICGLFNFEGYLCRHALLILSQNGVKEIPPQYILPRWRKDIKRHYVICNSFNGVDIDNPIHRYGALYKRLVQVIEEGTKSQDRYEVALRVIDETLSNVRLAEEKSS